jgi:hypothetical protein
MNRRNILQAGLAMLGTAAFARRTFGAAESLASVAREAWLYAVPLIEVASFRQRILAKNRANVFVHNRDLTNVETQKVTSPNNDTIYSYSMLDLRAGPVALTLPAAGARYFSLQLVDMYTNNVAILGTRTIGGHGGRFLIAGPTADAPRGTIRAPQDWVFALARTLVDGQADLPAARAVQDGLGIAGKAGQPPATAVPARSAPWNDFLAGAGALIAELPPPATDDAMIDRLAPLGLSRTGFQRPDFSAAEVDAVESGMADARTFAGRVQLGQQIIDGWAYPPCSLGRFEQDYGFRAQIAVGGLFALPVEEALYTRSVGDTQDGLFHGDAYHMRFPAGALPPVDAFWSMTLYEATNDGQFFLTPNAIGRFAIGDRTPGLVRGKDGSLDVWIARTDPGPERRSNWLPAPQSRPFVLTMRAYLPQQALQNGTYRFPPVLPTN